VVAGRTVGTARFTVRAGTSRKVEVKLNRAGRRAARRHPGRLKIRVAMR
jgi:hypothetical protein